MAFFSARSSFLLRLMRLVRFAAQLGFSVEPETAKAARALCHLVRDIKAERIWEELKKLLLTADAERGLLLMLDLGLMAEVLPEVAAGTAIRQRTEYHDFDVAHHMIHAVPFAGRTVVNRLAALLHDIGKPPQQQATGRMVMHDHVGAAMMPAIGERLRMEKDTVQRVQALIRYHMYDLNGRAKKSKVRWFFAQRGRQGTEDWLDLRRADFCGSKAAPLEEDPSLYWQAIYDEMVRQHAPFSIKELPVNGGEVAARMGEKPGPRVGAMLHALWRQAVVQPGCNQHDQLLRMVDRLMHNEQSWWRPKEEA